MLDSASIVLGVGHVDAVAFNYDDCRRALTLAVDDNTEPLANTHVLRDPARVLFHAGSAAELVLPELAAFAFLGDPGDTIWVLPETQIDSVVWPGFQTYGVQPGEVADDAVVLRLVSADGPGRFAAFFSPPDDVTPVARLFDPAGGVDEYVVLAATHLHTNWAFTSPGLYRLTFEATATLADGTEVTSAPHTYRFLVGDISTLPSAEPTVLVIDGVESSYVSGAMMTLTAGRHGAASTLPLAWSRSCYDPLTFEPLPWESLAVGDVLSTLARGDCQYRAQLMSGAVPVATSQAVTPYVGG
ncbi:MAG: choice-of-anchor M domain-containing protein [Deltaproteobacteria bacterium]|nr:choice-of-anchor M domain-containing protein [Deltaproteobacteria bacterium]